MSHVRKPAFETFRARLVGGLKPLAEKDLAPVQSAIVALLDTVPNMLVQKSKRVGHPEGLLEVTATWVGLDASQRAAIAALRAAWPGDLFSGYDESFCVAESDEAVLLLFAVRYPSDRFLTGRILVTF